MKAKLLRYTLYMSVIPFAGVVTLLIFKNNFAAMNLILITASALQMLITLICRKALMPLINPDTKVLSEIGIKYVPAPYEPGKYKIDSAFFSVIMWSGIAAPVLTRLAIYFPKEVNVDVLNNLKYTVPSTNLMAFAFLFLIVGTVAFPMWFQLSRAAAIYAQGSDKKRYLMRGFVDELDSSKHIRACNFSSKKH